MTTCFVSPNATCGYRNAECSVPRFRHMDILDPDVVKVDYVYCLMAYTVSLPLILVSCCSRESIVKNKNAARLSNVYVCLLISFTLRCFWLVSKGFGIWDDDSRVVQNENCSMCFACTWTFIPHLFNRFSVLAFFTAYSCVCKIWLDVWANNDERMSAKMVASSRAVSRAGRQGKRSFSSFATENRESIDDTTDAQPSTGIGPSEEHAPAARICCCNVTLFIVILNFWVYVIELVVEGVYIFSDYKQEVYDDIKDWNYRIVSTFFFGLGLLFLYTGGMLIKLLNKVDSFQGKRIQRNICAALAVIIFCFSLRSFMFLARPVFGLILPYPCFPYLFYPVPELVPTWILLYLTSSYTKLRSACHNTCSKIFPCAAKKKTGDTMDMLQEKLIPDHIGKQWIAQNETPNRTGSIAKSITKKEGETENDTPEEDTLFL